MAVEIRPDVKPGTDSVDLTVLEEYIEAQLEPFKVPGVAVAIVQGDDMLMARGFGQRDIEKDLPMTADTVMPIGSVTKSFTSALVASLVDDGSIEWDKPVRDHLPTFRMHDHVATDNMTPRDLLCHRSGLPRHDLVWYGNEKLTRAQAVERLRYLEPNAGFREVWQYNNLMYLTAGHLAETKLDLTWEDGVRARILEPLGMSATTFSVDEAQALADHARPYVLKEDELREVPYRGLDLAGPAGSINSSVLDMARWAATNVNGGTYKGESILSADAVKQLHKQTMVMPEGAVLWPEFTSIGYALGWMLHTYRGHRVVEHGGNVDGFSAMVSLLPSLKLGVVVLTNRHGTPLRDVIPLRVFDHFLGLDALPWETRYREMFESMMAGAKEGKTHRSTTAKGLPPSHPLEEFVGRYDHPAYGEFEVRQDDGKLVPIFRDLRVRMNHLQLDTFELEIEPFDEGPGVRLSFLTDFDGEVSGFKAELEPTVDPIEFKKLPDDSLRDLAVYASYAGRYTLGPIVLEVSLDGDDLYAQAMGQPRAKLTPRRPRVFTTAGSDNTLEFVEENGAIVRAVTSGVVFQREETTATP